MRTLKELIINDLESNNIKKNVRYSFNVDFEEFNEIIKQFSKQVIERRNEKNTYIATNEDVRIIRLFHDWLICNEQNINPNKGILLTGAYGCGKTILLESFYRFYKLLAENRVKGFYLPIYTTAIDLVNRVNLNGITLNLINEPLFIDDLGREPIEVKNYGNNNSPIIELFLKRYEAGSFTFATSNFKFATLITNEKYGLMVGDRMTSMFTWVEKKGDSRRTVRS